MDLRVNSKSPLLIERHRYSAWELIKLFWQSEYKIWAYWFYILLVILTIVLVGFDVALTYWYNYFYNSLQAYDLNSVLKAVGLFILLAAGNMVVAVYRYYLSQLFALRWRNWLTTQFINRWLQKRGYYYLEQFDQRTDNPDQRIQEDVHGLITNFVSITLGLISAITTVPAFIYILWSLSGIIYVPLGSWGYLEIHGYLVWVAILYNLIGTWITFKIGYPLIKLNFDQQQLEATFRFSAIDLRNHSEQVALYRGEHHQKQILNDGFFKVLQNWYAIVLRQKLLLWFTVGFNQAAVLIPLLATLPNYFRKVFMLGGLMQSLKAFSQIQESLSFFVNAYTQLAQWKAISDRLTSFINHLHESEQNAESANKVIRSTQANNTLTVKDFSIRSYDNKPLLDDINLEFQHGEHYVIKGESGLGKSTFIRTIAGVWPYASGEVIFPSKQKFMYLPQKPYMPMGTLKEAILFPDKKHPEFEAQVEDVMNACHLEAFIKRLDDMDNWAETLSPGEQQRVSFARVLLHKPDWVFLDESTSMLDSENETRLYHLIKERLPACTIISVGHHPSVDVFHDHVLNLMKYRHGDAASAGFSQ